MDRLQLQGMRFFGRHGALPAERELGQHFRVDAELEMDLEPAFKSGRLADTLDYRAAHQVAREVIEGEPLELLEAVAGRIAAGLLDLDGRIQRVRVRVAKRPPLAGQFDEFAVEVERHR